jgi:hypothetical protein
MSPLRSTRGRVLCSLAMFALAASACGNERAAAMAPPRSRGAGR